MITRIIIGFLISCLGFLLVWKTDWFMSIMGYVEWAEKWLGGGGTRLFYKLLGTLIIVIGLMVITNLFDSVIGGAISGFFGGAK